MHQIIKIQLALVLFFAINFSYAQRNIQIVNFDIGQGDATFIKSVVSADSIITVLFDTGGYNSLSGEDAGLIINHFLRNEGIHKIDYLIISHYDADHIGGVAQESIYGTSFYIGPDKKEGTSDDIKVHNVIDRGDSETPSSTIFTIYKDFAEKHNRKSIDSPPELNYTIELGNDAKMICLAQNGYVSGRANVVPNTNTENERSLSFLLTYKDFDFLISGDLIGRSPYSGSKEDARIEAAVGQQIKDLRRDIEVLHVNHHGADNTSESDFLMDIKADVAIISCGEDNRHEHPRTEALIRLHDAGVQDIFKTNEGTPNKPVPEEVKNKLRNFDGHIVINTDGSDYSIYKHGYPHHKNLSHSYRSKK